MSLILMIRGSQFVTNRQKSYKVTGSRITQSQTSLYCQSIRCLSLYICICISFSWIICVFNILIKLSHNVSGHSLTSYMPLIAAKESKRPTLQSVISNCLGGQLKTTCKGELRRVVLALGRALTTTPAFTASGTTQIMGS